MVNPVALGALWAVGTIRMLSIVGQSSDLSLYYEILWGLTAKCNPPDVDYPVVEELWIWFPLMKRLISCCCFFHFGLGICFACDSLSTPRVPAADLMGIDQ